MIELKKISIAYDGHTVLTGEKFIAYDTGITVIYGESGSGKTSLLKSILLWEYQCERYFFNGKQLEQKGFETIRNQYFASLSQQSTLIDQLNIAGHFDLFKNNQKAEELIEKLALQNLMKKYPPQLSGGEKTRVGLALAILRNQPILVLDEPTASLDTEMARRIIELIQAYAKEHSVIISTHDRKIIEIADNVYEIDQGSLKLLKQQETIENKAICLPVTMKFSLSQELKLFHQLKKRKLLYHIMMKVLLVISISFTSFGLSI